MITLDFADVPSALQSSAVRYWDTFNKNREALALAALHTLLPATLEVSVFARQLTRVFIGSEYVANKLAVHPLYLIDLLQSGDLYSAQTQVHLDVIAQQIKSASSTSELDSRLRQARHRAMIRLIWRDLNRLASMQEVTSELSRFADLMIQLTAEYHYRDLEKTYGTPLGKDSHFSNNSKGAQPFIVLGMGKLGAGELNISSDVDLIFTFPESGTTQHAARAISNQEFFIKLGQRLIQSLDTVTAEGFVFRVDMRLRPHGQSGVLALSYAAMEDYYQTQGREWERYAMIKARSVALVGGEQPKRARAQLRKLLQPFTYRQYIDFTAIESLREMKALIARQVQRKGMSLDVKLGEGGIREVEFVVQVFQLIRGGRDMALRRRKVAVLLPYLEQQGYLPEGSGARLLEAYIFLRNTEHALQAYQDQQTQSLPTDTLSQQRLAWVMGFADWNAFSVALQKYRDYVNREFKLVIAPPEREFLTTQQHTLWLSLWEGSLEGAEALQALTAKHLEQPEQFLKQLSDLRHSRSVQAMQPTSRTRLDIFLPQLLEMLWQNQQEKPLPLKKVPLSYLVVLARIIPLIEAIARRSAYLVLLVENPGAIQQLISLCAASPWIADQLTQHPALLDELLSPKNLYAPPDKEQLRNELRHELLRLTEDDLEGQMEALRYFRSAHALRVAASEVMETLPLMKVSDYLTYIAEVILEQALHFSWQQLVARHGSPIHTDGTQETSPQFVIVGYGKLGGIELSHGSDLDLVFIHNTDAQGQTRGLESEPGKGVIDNLTFYTRLAQKIIHLLNTYTPSGKLYEVDMRLRPSGDSGLLVTSLAAFEKYQLNEAWTWEHQALVRARVVAGDPLLAESFALVRQKVLCRERNLEKLRDDVSSMRRKMREQLGSQGKSKSNKSAAPLSTTSEGSQEFNLKQDAGGIVDIEFMVQYAALAWAFTVPEIIRYTDNIRILGSLEDAGLLDADSVAHLIAAYKAYRSTGHRLALQQQEAILDGDNHFQTERAQVTALWHKLMLWS